MPRALCDALSPYRFMSRALRMLCPPSANVLIRALFVYRRFASLAPLKRDVEGLKPSTPPTDASCLALLRVLCPFSASMRCAFLDALSP